jgi:glycosyltransferase involved in cell wall biosynthesis
MAGGPQNLYSLFSQFPADSYCVLTSYHAIQRAQSTGKWLAGKYFFYDHAGNIDKNRASPSSTRGWSPVATAHESLLLLAGRLPRIGRELLLTVIHAVYLILGIFMILRAGILIVRQRNIQCIVGISDIGPALISTYLISRWTGVPYVLYFFDIYLGNNRLLVNDLFAKFFEPRMFRNASLVIVTNEGTEKFYRRRYGDTFRCAVIHNSVFPETYESKRTPYDPREPYSIVFTGHVYWAQERSLVNLIRAMNHFDLPVRVDLYAPVASELLRRCVANCTNVQLTSAPLSEMPDVQCRATILFLPLSWHTGRPEVIATATPGKLADYLASGRPVLIHAPPYAYLGEYARKEGFALVVDEEDTQKLRESVRRLVSDVQYSRQLIENAKRTLKNHDAAVNARRLASILNSL